VFRISKKKLIYFSLSIALAFFVLFLASLFKKPLQTTIEPELNLLWLIRREISGIAHYHRNYLENDKLHNETDFLRSKLISLEELAQENRRLKGLLTLKQNSPLKLIIARVIGRLADNWSSGVIIDKGRNSGIKRGMAAINYLGLVGRVIECGDTSSKVMLISDPNLGVSGVVQRSREEGLVNGTLGGNLIMRYLPEDADIMVNDIVVTSELSGSYPKGLAIGKIISIGKEFSGLNRYAVIKPAADLLNIEELLLIVQ